MRTRKLRPVGGIPRSAPSIVPSRSNSTTIASSASAWYRTTFSLRWSGNVVRVLR
jgi:hypothetical protein